MYVQYQGCPGGCNILIIVGPIDMGVKQGMYHGVQSTWHFNPYELRRESIKNLFCVNMKQNTTVTIGANVTSTGSVSLRDAVA